MSSLSLFQKKLVLIFALVLATLSWQAELHSASIYLSWTSTSDNEDGFRIIRFVAGYVDAILTVPAKVISYTDSALVAGTVYCYRVEAFNSAGDSDPSNLACVTAIDE
jgi:Fibronectin type III domain